MVVESPLSKGRYVKSDLKVKVASSWFVAGRIGLVNDTYFNIVKLNIGEQNEIFVGILVKS